MLKLLLSKTFRAMIYIYLFLNNIHKPNNKHKKHIFFILNVIYLDKNEFKIYALFLKTNEHININTNLLFLMLQRLHK